MFDKHSEPWRSYEKCVHCGSRELKIVAGTMDDPLITCKDCGLVIAFNTVQIENSVLTIPYEQVGIAVEKAKAKARENLHQQILLLLRDEGEKIPESEFATKTFVALLKELVRQV